MKYDRVIQGTFIDRPNRFIANVRIEGEGDVPDPVVRCHIKNTGRCLELLVPGAKVVLSISDDPKRKTGYDLIAVYKGDLLINMDSQAPNAVVKESFEKIVGKCDNVVPEYRYGDSRFDFYAERNGEKVFAEVKGVTLESGTISGRPDGERSEAHPRTHGACRQRLQVLGHLPDTDVRGKRILPQLRHAARTGQGLRGGRRRRR